MSSVLLHLSEVAIIYIALSTAVFRVLTSMPTKHHLKGSVAVKVPKYTFANKHNGQVYQSNTLLFDNTSWVRQGSMSWTDHFYGNSCKRKHLIGSCLQFQQFSPL